MELPVSPDLGYCSFCFHDKSEHDEQGCHHVMSFRRHLIFGGKCPCKAYEPATFPGELSKNNPHHPDFGGGSCAV